MERCGLIYLIGMSPTFAWVMFRDKVTLLQMWGIVVFWPVALLGLAIIGLVEFLREQASG